MERYRKSVFYTTLIHIILALIVTAQEGPTLPAAEQPSYYIIRLFLIGLMGIILYPLKKDPFNSKWILTIATIYGLYSIHGQYYNPWYIFCFIQVHYGIAFLYPISRRNFLIYSLASSIGFAAMLFYRFEVFRRWAENPVKEDIFFTLFCSSAIALLANYFFTADRTYREETIRKFGLIGIQSTALVHDIKGLMATPRLYSQILIERLSKHPDAEAAQAVEILNDSLEQFNQVMIELNRMSTLHIQEKEDFLLSQVLQDVSEALSLERKNIQLLSPQDLKIHAEKAHFKSIVFNIILNSLQSFRRNNTPQPQIQVLTNDKRQIIFSDNAGGFQKDILERLNKGTIGSHQASGTGLGTYLILDSMKSLGGAALFQNATQGAEVVLSFPKQVLKT